MRVLKEKSFQTKPLIEPMLYHGLMDFTNMGMWIWYIQSEYVEISSVLQRMLCIENESTIYSTTEWMTKWHPEEKEILKDALLSSVRSQERNIQVVHRLKNGQGDFIWIHTKAYIVRDEHHQPIQMIGVSIDFSEFQDTLESLTKEKEMYQNFLKASKAATWWWNIQTDETSFDEAWANMLGYTLNELEPISLETWKKLTHPIDLEHATNILEDVFTKKIEYYDATFRMKHKDGRYVWISDRGKVISWLPDGKPHIMVGTHIDVTKEKELEIELIKKEAYYRNLLDSSYDIVYFVDLNYKMTYLSPTWTEKLGHSLEDGLNNSFEPYIFHEDLPKIIHFFEEVLKSGKRQEVLEYRLIHKDKSIRWFTTNATLVLNDHQNPIGFAGSARDITDEKLYKQAILKEKEQLQKTLMSLGDGVISTDYEGNIIFMNPIAKTLFCKNEVCLKHINKVLEQMKMKKQVSFQDIREKIIGQLKSLVYVEGNITNRSIYMEGVMSTIENEKNQIEGFSLILRDQTEKHQKQQEVEWLIHHDYLTSLYNRRYMEDSLDLYDDPSYLPVGVMMLDVNGLKRMNDVHGHHIGDELITLVADTLTESVAKKDTIARIGGDEFLILSPNTSEEEMYALKYQLLESFNHRIVKGNRLSVALGYAIKENEESTIRDVMKIADDYMYMNKNKKTIIR